MKILYRSGNLLDTEDLVIAHGCNAKGVFGSGVALQIKNRWPNVYEVYALRHKIFGLQLGEIIPVQTTDGKLILNCISQENYGRNGSRFVDYDAVFKIFTQINDKVLDWEVNEVSLPRIGAGLGGGDWNVISAIIEETSTNYTPVVWDYDQAVI